MTNIYQRIVQNCMLFSLISAHFPKKYSWVLSYHTNISIKLSAGLYLLVWKKSYGRPESYSSVGVKNCNLRRIINCASFGLINNFITKILCVTQHLAKQFKQNLWHINLKSRIEKMTVIHFAHLRLWFHFIYCLFSSVCPYV